MGLVTAGLGLYGAKLQADATKTAADQQAQAGRESNQLLRDFFEQTRADERPYQQAGEQALPTLQDLAGQEAGAPPRGYSSATTAPYFPEQFTGQVNLEQDPGYQFRLQEGQRAVERSAASKGMLQSGNTLKDLTRFGQGLASQEYGAAYQRALGTNQQRALLGQQGYQNQVSANDAGYQRGVQDYTLDYNRAQTDLTGRFNRYATLAGLGQTAVGQLTTAGQNYGSQIGQNILGIGNVNAAGTIGVANARNRGLQAIGQGLNQDTRTATSLFSAFGGG